MQKTRPRRKGKQTAPSGDTERKTTVGRGRPTHVRNRLIVAVAVVAAAIAGAGAPSVIAASAQLNDAQDLLTLAERTQDALTLAHSLADERDEAVPYIAAGRPPSGKPSKEHTARVDRQLAELRADTDTPQALRDVLDTVTSVRQEALGGKGSALDAHQAYSDVIGQLHRLADQLAEQTPPRAGSGAHALAELDAAVQQAAATRGLLLAALNVPRTTQTSIDPITGLPITVEVSSEDDAEQRDALTAAALQARLRSDAGLADFRQGAPEAASASYDSTVNGPEVDSAEEYLASLTDEPALSESELDTDTEKLANALTARIEAMRGVESALYEERSKNLALLRDDDVTRLEIRIAVLGALILLTVGIATAMARSLTRPLSVLRRGSARLADAADPSTEEPVTFTGRNDEFAQVVRSVNALHAHAAGLAERIATLETDRKHLVGRRQKTAEAREELRTGLDESAARLKHLRAGVGGPAANLALRTLGLVERQLGVIEGMEDREDDPERLSTLFRIDHFATVMRRHTENLLVLAGTEHGRRTAGPVPLVDVVRAAVSEIEQYERVRIAALPPHAHVTGEAADALSHLLAELMENATSYSPSEAPVEVSGLLRENGDVVLSVQDEGTGMDAGRLERLNSRLSGSDPQDESRAQAEDGPGLGLYVVARLARRHGVRVELRAQEQGGVAAVAVLPASLLPPAPAPNPVATRTVSRTQEGAGPGSDPVRDGTESDDPLIALAEKAIRDREAATDDAPAMPIGARGEESAHGHPEEAAPAGTDTSAPDPTGRAAHPLAEDETEPTEGHGDETEPTEGEGTGPDGPGAPRDRGAGEPDEAVAGRFEPSEGRAGEPAGEPERNAGGADLLPETTMELLMPARPDRAGEPSERTAPSQPVRHEPAPEHGSGPDDTRGAQEPGPRPHDRPETRPASSGTGAGTGPGAASQPPGTNPSAVTGRPRPASGASGAVPPPGALPRQPVAGVDEGTEHARVADGGQDAEPEPVTAKGLPKRTPKIDAPAAPPRRRTGSMDAEALRRRLGGFRRGADAGHRDVSAEIAERTGRDQAPHHPSAPNEKTAGDTVEEASS